MLTVHNCGGCAVDISSLAVIHFRHTTNMPTTKRRINISVPKEMDEALTHLARRDQMPQATKTLHLLQIALELEEDVILDAIASKRDVRGARFISHSRAWR